MPCPYFEAACRLEDIPGAGVGVVALVALLRGQRVLSEEPAAQSLSLARLEASVPAAAREAQVRADIACSGDAAHQQRIWQLCDVTDVTDAATVAAVEEGEERGGRAVKRPKRCSGAAAERGQTKSAVGVFQSNAFATGAGRRGLFLRAFTDTKTSRVSSIFNSPMF